MTARFLKDIVIHLTHLHFLLVVVDLPCDLDMHCTPLARFLKILRETEVSLLALLQGAKNRFWH